MKIDLSEYKGLMRQISDDIIVRKLEGTNWVNLYVQCEFHCVLVDKWLPTLYKISTRPINN